MRLFLVRRPILCSIMLGFCATVIAQEVVMPGLKKKERKLNNQSLIPSAQSETVAQQPITQNGSDQVAQAPVASATAPQEGAQQAQQVQQAAPVQAPQPQQLSQQQPAQAQSKEQKKEPAKDQVNGAASKAQAQAVAPEEKAQKVEPEPKAEASAQEPQGTQSNGEQKPAAAPEAKDQQAADVQEIKGIDTVDIDEPQGNWLLKRIWWQRAQTQYEKIKALVEAILEARMVFFAKRTEWDRKIFDPFYVEIGISRGVLEEILSNLVSRIQDERSKQGALNEEERMLLQALEAEKATLEQLQKDIQVINEIDAKVDDAISILIQQLNRTRGFENQAWQNFKQIGQELSDKKARELYYGMSTYWQNINEIGAYLQGPYLQYFDQLGKQAQEQISKVSATIKSLKEKGIDFKKQWQMIEDKARNEKDKVPETPKAPEKPKEERGFFGKILDTTMGTVASLWGMVKSGVSTVWDFTIGRFFKKSTADVTVSPQIPAQQPQSAPAGDGRLATEQKVPGQPA